MLADNIIERGALRLQNLNSDEALKDIWSNGGAYKVYGITYTAALIPFHYYYYRATYKYVTTDQSPTWCNLYMQGWDDLAVSIVSNPVANAEYTSSTVNQCLPMGGVHINTGAILNGPKNAINGVTPYVKNVLCYDITDLYNLLLASGDVTDASTMKTWCDANLDFVPGRQYLDISSLLPTGSSTIQMKNGVIIADQIVEPDGMKQYSVSAAIRDNCWFDDGSGLLIYNSKNSTVTHTRVSAAEQGSPFAHEHPYVLKIETNGEAGPGAGGFIANHMSAANKVFIERFVAKVPIGYTVRANYNLQGDNARVRFITSNIGTGKWEEYAILYRCGSTGTFHNGGHVYISGPDNTSVTWYLAYANNCDVTGHEELIDYTVLPKKHSFRKGRAFAKEFDCVNLLTNGDGSDQSSGVIPPGWSYDTEDVAGDAIASIVQPVGALGAQASGGGFFGGWLRIDPCCQYKFSMWVKCKGDMSRFLTALCFSPEDKNAVFYHASTIYIEGTKTTLAADLNTGDTQMTVTSNANWVAHSYSTLGFRSSYYSSYNNLGTLGGYDQTGWIAGVSGSNIVTFNKAYTGSTISKGTYVVESFGGSNYPYPFMTRDLPTDNTWKYLEAYFGTNDETPWDGRGTGWQRIPADARYLRYRLNMDTNDGTVPIKYADIRITPVSRSNGRLESKIAFKHYT